MSASRPSAGLSCATATAFAGLPARVAMADGRPYHDAGASEVQELAAVLATVAAFIEALPDCMIVVCGDARVVAANRLAKAM